VKAVAKKWLAKEPALEIRVEGARKP